MYCVLISEGDIYGYTAMRSSEVNFQIPTLQPKNNILVVKSDYYGWSSVRKGELEYFTEIT